MASNELDELSRRLAALIVRGLGVRSQWALKTALEAGDTEGIAGVMVVRLPPKSKDYIDVDFTVGTVDVISRWGASA